MKWIATLVTVFSACASAQAKQLAYNCGGTEPFWSLSIVGNDLTLEEVGLPARSIRASRINAEGMQEGHVTVYTSAKGKAAVASVIKGKCTDHMSEHEYAYHLVFAEAGRALYGCCDEAK